jgi:hypothetical protein
MNQAEQLAEKLEKADPFGRVDIALLKIADRIGQKLAPEEWPILRPLAAKVLHERFGPKEKKRASRRPKSRPR